mgnify:CR=1 FL=1
MRSIAVAFLGLSLAMMTHAGAAPELSYPPKPRPSEEDPFMLAQASTSNLAFSRRIDGFRARARAAGIRDSVFNAAIQGVRYNTGDIQKDRNHSEFT